MSSLYSQSSLKYIRIAYCIKVRERGNQPNLINNNNKFPTKEKKIQDILLHLISYIRFGVLSLVAKLANANEGMGWLVGCLVELNVLFYFIHLNITTAVVGKPEY